MTFPINPSPGDSYTDAYGTVWVYAGTVNGWYRQIVSTQNDTTYTSAISGPAGSNTQVQFNDNGELAGDSGLTYNKTTDALSGGAFIPTGSTVPTNGLYRPSANNVSISTNSTERLRITSAGLVGVGTNSPIAQLHVDGSGSQNIRVSSTTHSNFIQVGCGSGSTYHEYKSVYRLVDTDNGERLRITSAGLVGVGTSTPESYKDEAEQLVVSKAGNCGITVASATNGVGAFYFADGTSGSDASRGGLYYSHIDNSMQLLADGSARVHITSAGLVGIGTSSPSNKLDVVGVTQVYDSRGTSGYDSLKFIGGSGVDFPTIEAVSTTSPLYFKTNSNVRMAITSGGSVGIGTTVVNSKLSIGNAASTNDGLTITFTGDNSTLARFYADTTTGQVSIGGIGATYYPAFYAGGTERARIDSSGRLLVGTSSAETWYNSRVQIQASGSEASYLVIRNSNDTGGSAIYLGKSRGTTANAVTVVQDGDGLGEISFLGADGTDVRTIGARIQAVVDGSPGVDDLPTRLVLSTTAAGASSPTERMRIKNNGTINFSNVAVYADNAAATTGGLAVGDVYRTSTGQLMIRY